MRITRVRLRNYRVYEELDLELPPGLVGIYGSNGTGKSTLVESIRWTLYGRGRTANDEILLRRLAPFLIAGLKAPLPDLSELDAEPAEIAR